MKLRSAKTIQPPKKNRCKEQNCHYSTNSSRKIYLHLRRHQEIVIFTCGNCDKKFPFQFFLKRHKCPKAQEESKSEQKQKTENTCKKAKIKDEISKHETITEEKEENGSVLPIRCTRAMGKKMVHYQFN